MLIIIAGYYRWLLSLVIISGFDYTADSDFGVGFWFTVRAARGG